MVPGGRQQMQYKIHRGLSRSAVRVTIPCLRQKDACIRRRIDADGKKSWRVLVDAKTVMVADKFGLAVAAAVEALTAKLNAA